MGKTVTLAMVKANPAFSRLIEAANNNLEVMGYTEHGIRHVGYVSRTTANILKEIGCDERTAELGAIAGWIHDIGNVVNRINHGLSGAVIAFELLHKMGMPMEEIAVVTAAIGNHEEQTGLPVNAVSAALILADKSDAHRSRVRKRKADPGDIHDRGNLSVKKNYLAVDNEKHAIRLVIFMDDTSATMEYLQIYFTRMVLCEKAADFLGYKFELVINNAIINRQQPRSTRRIPKTEKEVSEE